MPASSATHALSSRGLQGVFSLTQRPVTESGHPHLVPCPPSQSQWLWDVMSTSSRSGPLAHPWSWGWLPLHQGPHSLSTGRSGLSGEMGTLSSKRRKAQARRERQVSLRPSGFSASSSQKCRSTSRSWGWGRRLTPDLALVPFSLREAGPVCAFPFIQNLVTFTPYLQAHHTPGLTCWELGTDWAGQSVTGQGQPGASWGLPAPALPRVSWLLVGSETGLGEETSQRSPCFQALFEVRLCPPDLMSRCWLLGGFWEQVAHWLAVESVFCPLTLTGLVIGPWKCC